MSVIDESLVRHRLEYNGEFSNFKMLLLIKNTVGVVQILQSLSYKAYSILLPTFSAFVLLILVMGMPSLFSKKLVTVL